MQPGDALRSDAQPADARNPEAQPADALTLDNQLCFPLYAAAREVIKQYNAPLAALGLTYTQYITLLVLWEQGSVSVKALGKRLYLDSGTLTPLLKGLEQKGYVRRVRSTDDERVVNAVLTDAGYALRDRAACIPPRIAACVPLDANEAHTLHQLLRKILAGVAPAE